MLGGNGAFVEKECSIPYVHSQLRLQLTYLQLGAFRKWETPHHYGHARRKWEVGEEEGEGVRWRVTIRGQGPRLGIRYQLPCDGHFQSQEDRFVGWGE